MFFTSLGVHEERLPLDTLALVPETELFLLLGAGEYVQGQAGRVSRMAFTLFWPLNSTVGGAGLWAQI